nr:putative late blight resistance protein homolog R1B-16 isoform X1 [Ipomoea batatas]
MDFENENSDDFYNFVHLRQLEKLSIKGWHLELQDRGIQWKSSFLPNLKKLKFFKTRLPWSDMRLIVLEHLELSSCNLLRKIPIEFADITTLALIQLKKCRYSVLVSALCIQDEQRRYGNDGLCVRSKHTQTRYEEKLQMETNALSVVRGLSNDNDESFVLADIKSL